MLEDDIMAIYESDEKKISQLEHAIQSAYLAETDVRISNQDSFIKKCIVVASFLHDIGHLLDSKSLNHEIIGSEYLQKLKFPRLVCLLVQSHVDAKRFKLTVNSEYMSKQKLEQKLELLMSPDELKKFRKTEYFTFKLLLRDYDDKANMTDFQIDRKKFIEKIKEYIHCLISYSPLFIF